MTVRTFAERILFGATLADKLAADEPLADDEPGRAIAVPPAPARPAALAFPTEKVPFEFPDKRQLDDDGLRGRALHFFANHELLALELMALVLLRFPEAPSSFRAGLVHTMLDEQKHLRLYRARMAALGVELGDVKVNDYFWRAMKDVRSPLDFVISMSLTFEQANLDFTRHYAGLCRSAGDEATADILDAVQADEVRHVQHGVRWLEAWRDPEEDDWDAYRLHLAPPLSPARAKGPDFDREARRRAGLSERFIRELAVFQHSKGRTPVVHAFDAASEEAIEAGPRYSPPAAILDAEHDLAPLMLFLAANDDVVLVPVRPSTAHLESLIAAGFAVPELRTLDEPLAGPFERFSGWGAGPRSRARAERLGLSLDPAPPEVVSRRFSHALRQRLSPDTSAIATSVEEARAAAEAIFALGHPRAVAKSLFASSGRQRIFLRPGPLEPNLERWLEGRTVIVEPWLDRVRDLSLAIEVGEHATERVAFNHFLTDDRGRYRGHVLAPPLRGLELEPLFRRIDLFAELDRIARTVGQQLRAAGHRGPAGIDMLLYRDQGDGAIAWQPLVEVNPRLTMGFVARALKRRIAPGSYGVWLHAPIERVRELRPEVELSSKGIVRGTLPTNDLEAARAIGTVLYVDPDPDAIEALCRSR